MTDSSQNSFDDREIENLRECLKSGWVTQGPKTLAFERLFTSLHNVKYAFATTSFSSALHVAFLAAGLRSGDEVIVPAYASLLTGAAPERAGCRPVFADVDPVSCTLDAQSVQRAISKRTRAVLVTHLFGIGTAIEPILALAKRHDLRVIEDAAAGTGTSSSGRPVGGSGDVACFSLGGDMVVTTGEGGIVATNSDTIAEAAQSFRNHGTTGMSAEDIANPGPWSMSTFDNLGYNYRISDIQAAIGMAQMNKMGRLLEVREAQARLYGELLASCKAIVLPLAVPGRVWQSYAIRVRGGVSRRDGLWRALSSIVSVPATGAYALNRIDYYRKKYGLGDFPNAAAVEDSLVALPIGPGVTTSAQEHVAQVVRECLSSKTS